MSVLADTSAWIDYFRGEKYAEEIDLLIEDNMIVTNRLILAELIPPLHIQKQKQIIRLLKEVERYPLAIDWDDIIKMQITCLENGINKVGIPDLIIAQNAIQNNLRLLSADRHFALISRHTPLALYE